MLPKDPLTFKEKLDLVAKGKHIYVPSCPTCSRIGIHYNLKRAIWLCYSCRARFEVPKNRLWVPPRFTKTKAKSPEDMPSTKTTKSFLKSYRKDRITQALMITLYLTGGRISEVIKRLRKEQITCESVQGIKIYSFERMPVLKRRRAIPRTVVVSPSDNDLMALLLEYIAPMRDEEVLFNMERITAWRRIKKADPSLFCHWFRHAAVTAKATDDNFDALQLKKHFGWATLSEAPRYAHLTTADLKRKLLDNFKERHSQN